MPGPFASFLAEHGALRAGLARLKGSLEAPAGGREDLSASLDALLPELFQHEAAESEAWGAPGAPPWAARAMAGHLALRSLAKDVQLVRRHPDAYELSHLARLARLLHDEALAHLAAEEAAAAD